MSRGTVVYNGAQDIVAEVERDGFFVLKDYFSEKAVAKARSELEHLLDRDLAARREEHVGPGRAPVARMDRGRFKTTVTPLMHSRLFPSWESEAFAELMSDMLCDSFMQNFIGEVLGEHIRLRVDLIRRSSGSDDTVDDFQIPHEWHRDTPGEFTFGVFFDDVAAPFSGGTSVIPGTHWEKLDPRWDLLLAEGGRPTHDLFKSGTMRRLPEGVFAKAPLNQQLRAELAPNARELCGRPGDIYLFLNDTWHGRFPNKTGKQLMIARMGGFAADFDFKDDIQLPAGSALAPDLQRHYEQRRAVNSPQTLLNRIQNRTVGSDLRAAAANEKLQLIDSLAL